MAKTEQRRNLATGRKRLTGEVARAVRAALGKKAADVVVLDLRKTAAFTDFFVLCSGQNARQVKAIADAGGITVVQSIESSEMVAMPAAALQAAPGSIEVDAARLGELLNIQRTDDGR